MHQINCDDSFLNVVPCGLTRGNKIIIINTGVQPLLLKCIQELLIKATAGGVASTLEGDTEGNHTNLLYTFVCLKAKKTMFVLWLAGQNILTKNF